MTLMQGPKKLNASPDYSVSESHQTFGLTDCVLVMTHILSIYSIYV